MEAGKPEDIARRIVDGKMNKFFEQEVLLEQAFAKDPSKSVKQYLEEAAGKDATVVRFIRFKLGEGSDE
jgi:elongation factor Ts